MNPSLLKVVAEVKDQCSDPQIINMGIEWTVSTADNTYNMSADKKTIQFKEFPSGVRYIYVSVKLLFRKLSDPLALIEKVSDTLNIQLVDQPFSLNVD